MNRVRMTMHDRTPWRRLFCAVLLVARFPAFAAGPLPDRDPKKGLLDPSARVRLNAAKTVTEQGGREGLEVLARLLLDDDFMIRLESAECLRSLTEDSPDYFPDSPINLRRKATLNWLRWARTDGQAAELHLPLPEFKTVDLFNGVDIANWQAVDAGKLVAAGDVWQVRDRTILCNGQARGYLRTKQEYKNYLLTVEWRWPAAVNASDSGVFLMLTGADANIPHGLETQLLSGKAGDFWMLASFSATVDGKTTRSYAPKLAATSEKPQGQWNRTDILVRNGEVSVRINGVLQNMASDCGTAPGKIGLQVEGHAIQFRNIRLMRLSD